MEVVCTVKISNTVRVNDEELNIGDFLSSSNDHFIFCIYDEEKDKYINYGFNKSLIYPPRNRNLIVEGELDTKKDNILIKKGIDLAIANYKAKRGIYVNFESLGVFYASPYEDVGVILPVKKFNAAMESIWRIFIVNKTDSSIPAAAGLETILHPALGYYVGALHCQDNYSNAIATLTVVEFSIREKRSNTCYTLINLETKKYITCITEKEMELFTSLNKKLQIQSITRDQKTIIYNILGRPEIYPFLTEEEKDSLEELGYNNKFRYPYDYYEAMKLERKNKSYKNKYMLCNMLSIGEIIPTFIDSDGVIRYTPYQINIKNTHAIEILNIIKEFFKFPEDIQDSEDLSHKKIKIMKMSLSMIFFGCGALQLYNYTKNREVKFRSIIDLSIVGCTPDKASEYISEFADFLKLKEATFTIIQHTNFIDLALSTVIFRIHNKIHTSISSLLHSIDIDSDSIGMSGDCFFFCTHRFMNYLRTGYNILNFDRMSESYMYELLRRTTFGIKIWTPLKSLIFADFCTDVNSYSDTPLGILNAFIMGSDDFENFNQDDSWNQATTVDNFIFNTVNFSGTIKNESFDIFRKRRFSKLMNKKMFSSDRVILEDKFSISNIILNEHLTCSETYKTNNKHIKIIEVLKDILLDNENLFVIGNTAAILYYNPYVNLPDSFIIKLNEMMPKNECLHILRSYVEKCLSIFFDDEDIIKKYKRLIKFNTESNKEDIISYSISCIGNRKSFPMLKLEIGSLDDFKEETVDYLRLAFYKGKFITDSYGAYCVSNRMHLSNNAINSFTEDIVIGRIYKKYTELDLEHVSHFEPNYPHIGEL